MRTKIYTKSGDFGETSLLGGPRVSKMNPQLEAYGNLDEVNALLGLNISELKRSSANASSKAIINTIEKVQHEIFTVCSHLACSDSKLLPKLPKLNDEIILLLEKNIDLMDNSIPQLKNFILPGGLIAAAQLHVTRTVVRRAERTVIGHFAINKILEKETQNKIIMFLNRLSDYLFVAARYINFSGKEPEKKWN
ncbi:MAG: ATP:cob(I)alamin adenosyltransferase [Bdellovibrionales bacterium RBG_16_40_8]|nr:MAG: ATP:cob(I)alamin adenosyltransferase [Bdellovibrionales bacterium RBG_16_40_8]